MPNPHDLIHLLEEKLQTPAGKAWLEQTLLQHRHPLDEEAPPSIQWNPSSPYVRELKRWDRPRSQGGYNADGFEMFPLMLYRARVGSNGKAAVAEIFRPTGQREQDVIEERRVEEFNRSCYTIVRDESERSIARGQGWCDSPVAAIAAFEAQADEIEMITAQRHFQDRRMSEHAQREARLVDESTDQQVPAIQAQPRRPGRPKKVAHVETV